MPCSAVTLSLATITAIVAVALLAIAFSTDNWLYIDVKRAQIHQVSSTVTLPLFTVISLQPLWNVLFWLRYWICFYVYTCAYRHNFMHVSNVILGTLDLLLSWCVYKQLLQQIPSLPFSIINVFVHLVPICWFPPYTVHLIVVCALVCI